MNAYGSARTRFEECLSFGPRGKIAADGVDSAGLCSLVASRRTSTELALLKSKICLSSSSAKACVDVVDLI